MSLPEDPIRVAAVQAVARQLMAHGVVGHEPDGVPLAAAERMVSRLERDLQSPRALSVDDLRQIGHRAELRAIGTAALRREHRPWI